MSKDESRTSKDESRTSQEGELAGADPKAPNRSQHWIPGRPNQHPIGMGTTQMIAHGACGVGRRL